MTALESLIKEKVLLLDGAMGTQIFAHKPTVDDYGGIELEGCVEIFNERRPDWIKGIHAAYFEAGADAVETNTFGCNEVVLAEFGLAHRTAELNAAAVRLAPVGTRPHPTDCHRLLRLPGRSPRSRRVAGRPRGALLQPR